MCAGYGLELRGPTSSSGDRIGRLAGSGVTFGQAVLGAGPGGEPAGEGPGVDATWMLECPAVREWLDSEHGTARITGRRARNLNPILRDGPSGREAELAWWWLHVGGAPARFSAFNSRADRLTRSWRDAFQHRALAPASWYVEAGVRFELPDGAPFALAAITAPVDAELTSYSIVTREAVAEVELVHDRMPLVLPPELYDEWLDPARTGDTELVARAVAASQELSAAFVATRAAVRADISEPPHPTLF